MSRRHSEVEVVPQFEHEVGASLGKIGTGSFFIPVTM